MLTPPVELTEGPCHDTDPRARRTRRMKGPERIRGQPIVGPPKDSLSHLRLSTWESVVQTRSLQARGLGYSRQRRPLVPVRTKNIRKPFKKDSVTDFAGSWHR